MFPEERKPEKVLFDQVIQVERKKIRVKKCENHLGQLVKIVEEGRYKHDTVVFPASGIDPLINTLLDARSAQ